MIASVGLPRREAMIIVLFLIAGVGCRSWDPLSYDFDKAVADEIEAPVTDGPDTKASLKAFVSDHGTGAVLFLVHVLAEERCATDGDGLLRAWTAVRAMQALGDPRSRSALESARDSACVNPTLRWQILRALAELDGRSTAPIAVDELASESSPHGAHLVVEILSSRDSSVAPRLAAIADHQKDVRDRAFFRFLSLVMETPSECRLNPNGSVPVGAGGFLCQYTCPASEMYHQERQHLACAQSVPLPTGPVAARMAGSSAHQD